MRCSTSTNRRSVPVLNMGAVLPSYLYQGQACRFQMLLVVLWITTWLRKWIEVQQGACEGQLYDVFVSFPFRVVSS